MKVDLLGSCGYLGAVAAKKKKRPLISFKKKPSKKKVKASQKKKRISVASKIKKTISKIKPKKKVAKKQPKTLSLRSATGISASLPVKGSGSIPQTSPAIAALYKKSVNEGVPVTPEMAELFKKSTSGSVTMTPAMAALYKKSVNEGVPVTDEQVAEVQEKKKDDLSKLLMVGAVAALPLLFL